MDTPTLLNLQTVESPDWCPGCGDFGILMGIKKAIVSLGRPLHETVIVSGIGCSGKLNHFVNVYGFEGLHGRTLPVAQAIHMANSGLNVIAVGGDGDGYGIGMEHFMHAMRRNMNITYIVHNNQVYGLTKGQYAPTTEQGRKTSSSPHGALEIPVNPIALAMAAQGATYVARGFAGDIKHLHELILGGINHKGFALIDVLQPCVTFNKVNSYDFYKARVYKLQEDTTYDVTNPTMAVERSKEWEKRIATGIFYQVQQSQYEEHISALKDKPLVEHDISDIDISPLYKEFM